MIVRILSRGKSFKGLSTYLTHDPEAETDKRVAWTHTVNLANDYVPSAVDEMLWTSRQAELLKQEAGIRAGGRATENAVKHLSLNWAPDENPTRDHMIDTTEEFLRHMNWQDHQALLVAHEDKEYRHVHVMLNAVHHETGLKLDEGFEQRRAQAWALEYEREHGRIYCEQRLLNPEEREDAPTRPAWMAFRENQEKFEREEKRLRENNPDFSENPKNAEWKKLKEIQRQQREAFFLEGKSEFKELRNSIYREVREEFRDRWGDYYVAQKEGEIGEAKLKEMKVALVAEQKDILERRRDEACAELLEQRKDLYRELLDDQKELRHGLRARQELGLDNTQYFDLIGSRNGNSPDITSAFRSAARETTEPVEAREFMPAMSPEAGMPFTSRGERDESHVKSGPDVGARVGEGIGFGLIGLFESLADGFVGAKPDPKPRRPEPEEPRGPNPFEIAAKESRERQRRDQEEAEREWRQKQRSYGE